MPVQVYSVGESRCLSGMECHSEIQVEPLHSKRGREGTLSNTAGSLAIGAEGQCSFQTAKVNEIVLF